MRILSCTSMLLFVIALPAEVGCSRVMRGVANNAHQMNTFQLMETAAVAHGIGSVEEAGFLMLAGQVRYQIDKLVFPPVGRGGNSPDVLNAALSATVGQAIASNLQYDPVAATNVAARLATWSPEFGSGYDPGWEYTKKLGDQETKAVVFRVLKSAVANAQDKAKLAQNAEYVKLSKIVKEKDAVQNEYMKAMNRAAGRHSKELQEKYDAEFDRLTLID